ncbi:hypothetical protein IMSAGC005_02891 [Lachnospiraceae bacterium]|nr:hypothetical protein IMSAGC005_02891 [Lachnospiraceae bacterium]
MCMEKTGREDASASSLRLILSSWEPALDFAEILEAMQTKIKIRIHKSIMDRVLDFCTYEDFLPDGAEYKKLRHYMKRKRVVTKVHNFWYTYM